MKRFVLLLATIFSFGLIVCSNSMAAAAYNPNPFHDTCSDPAARESSACQTDGSDPLTGPNGIVTKVARAISIITGAVSVIVLIIAGFSYITSAGDSTKAANARRAMIGAAIGIIIVILAQAFIILVLNNVN